MYFRVHSVGYKDKLTYLLKNLTCKYIPEVHGATNFDAPRDPPRKPSQPASPMPVDNFA